MATVMAAMAPVLLPPSSSLMAMSPVVDVLDDVLDVGASASNPTVVEVDAGTVVAPRTVVPVLRVVAVGLAVVGAGIIGAAVCGGAVVAADGST